jgi:hypothetical protein
LTVPIFFENLILIQNLFLFLLFSILRYERLERKSFVNIDFSHEKIDLGVNEFYFDKRGLMMIVLNLKNTLKNRSSMRKKDFN